MTRSAGDDGRLKFKGSRWLVAGTHMPAAAVLEMLAHGASAERIVEICPYLAMADMRACLALGAELTGRGAAG
ncbi:MAG TPA: DUF433 domain-containing protein [Allosphingosinicella sp.]|nr:DUF433 domain-containing protein [Allosphingosinicella sp.]